MPSIFSALPFLWTTPAKNVSRQLILHPTEQNLNPDQRYRQIINPRPEHTLFEWAAFRDHKTLLQNSKKPTSFPIPPPLPSQIQLPPVGTRIVKPSQMSHQEIPAVQKWAKQVIGVLNGTEKEPPRIAVLPTQQFSPQIPHRILEEISRQNDGKPICAIDFPMNVSRNGPPLTAQQFIEQHLKQFKKLTGNNQVTFYVKNLQYDPQAWASFLNVNSWPSKLRHHQFILQLDKNHIDEPKYGAYHSYSDSEHENGIIKAIKNPSLEQQVRRRPDLKLPFTQYKIKPEERALFLQPAIRELQYRHRVNIPLEAAKKLFELEGGLSEQQAQERLEDIIKQVKKRRGVRRAFKNQPESLKSENPYELKAADIETRLRPNGSSKSSLPPIRSKFLTETTGAVRLGKLPGNAELKEIAKKAVWALQNPDLTPELKEAILLYGKPGTGKDYSIAAFAEEVKVASGGMPVFVFSTPASEFSQKYVGDGRDMVKDFLGDIRKVKPYMPKGGIVIQFIDEIDQIGNRNTESSNGSRDEILTTLLTQLQGVKDSLQPKRGKTSVQVLTIAATNKEMNLDDALDNRFKKKIGYSDPSKKMRKALLKASLKKHRVMIEPDSSEHLVQKFEGLQPRKIDHVVESLRIPALMDILPQTRTAKKGKSKANDSTTAPLPEKKVAPQTQTQRLSRKMRKQRWHELNPLESILRTAQDTLKTPEEKLKEKQEKVQERAKRVLDSPRSTPEVKERFSRILEALKSSSTISEQKKEARKTLESLKPRLKQAREKTRKSGFKAQIKKIQNRTFPKRNFPYVPINRVIVDKIELPEKTGEMSVEAQRQYT